LEFFTSVTRALIYTTVLLLLVASLAACTDKGGQPPNSPEWTGGPVVGKLDLFCVAFADDRVAWAAGDIAATGEGGVMFQTTDAGMSWRAASPTTEILTSLTFVDARTGWAAGYAGRIEKTTDGGTSWKKQRSEREGEILNSIFFQDLQSGWAAGSDGRLLHTSNGGESWIEVNTGQVVDFWCVRFFGQNRGWLVGEDGMILASTDAGQSWTQQESGMHQALVGLAIDRSGTAVAAGAGGIVLRSSDGTHWGHIETGKSDPLNAVAASDDMFWVVGSKGAILGSTDHGLSWSDYGKSTDRLTSIDVRGAHGIAVGEQGATRLLRH
jgi:photosystem II stability/assembly factor-like uncharacterized protein